MENEDISLEDLKDPKIRDAVKAEIQRVKDARTNGTSVEKVGEEREIAALFTPEFKKELREGFTSALKDSFKDQVVERQKVTGEHGGEAANMVSRGVELNLQRKHREAQENKFIALYVRGRALKQSDDIVKAHEMEREYLGRATRAFGEDGKVMLQRTSMKGDTTTVGGEFVPEIFETRVIEFIEQHGIARRDCTVIPMTTLKHKFPKVTAGLTAYEVGAGDAITVSNATTDQLVMEARKLAVLVALENELLHDANPAITPIIMMLAAKAFANKEDTLCLTGASSTVVGILENTNNKVYLGGDSTSGATSIADVSFDDLSNLDDELESPYLTDKAKYYFNKKVLKYLRQLQSANDYLWKPAAQGAPKTIHGYGYETSSLMSGAPAVNTAFGFFGDLSNMWMGDRQQMEVAIGTEGTVGSDNLFEKDMSAIRVIERVEFEQADTEAFALLVTAAS